MLSGLLLILGAVWTRYAFNRLWQQSLSEDAAEAIQAAPAVGLVLQPLAWRPRVVATGTVDGQPIRVEWRGGVRGAHTLLVRAGQRQRLPLVTSDAALRDLLAG